MLNILRATALPAHLKTTSCQNLFSIPFYFGAKTPGSLSLVLPQNKPNLNRVSKLTACSSLPLTPTLLPMQGTARLCQWNAVTCWAVEGWEEEGTVGRRDRGTEGHMAMLTEKVVLVTSPLLCAMPPLRLPGMPAPWCFFWLPTIVSMEWLRTRMALCAEGTGDSTSAPPSGVLHLELLPSSRSSPGIKESNLSIPPQEQAHPKSRPGSCS